MSNLEPSPTSEPSGPLFSRFLNVLKPNSVTVVKKKSFYFISRSIAEGLPVLQNIP